MGRKSCKHIVWPCTWGFSRIPHIEPVLKDVDCSSPSSSSYSCHQRNEDTTMDQANQQKTENSEVSPLVGDTVTSAPGYSSGASTPSLTYSASPHSSSESSDTLGPLPDESTSIARPAGTVIRSTNVTFATLPRPDHIRPNQVQSMAEQIESLIRSEQGPETSRMVL
jgi:hypothetical protein